MITTIRLETLSQYVGTTIIGDCDNIQFISYAVVKTATKYSLALVYKLLLREIQSIHHS
jgi:hypothetical protein